MQIMMLMSYEMIATFSGLSKNYLLHWYMFWSSKTNRRVHTSIYKHCSWHM